MPPRSKKASIADVARLAGVSVGTVSNSLNKPDSVAPATLKRVKAAISELGFVPNSSARMLRTGKQKVVGLIVTNISNPFYTEVVRGIEDRLTKDDYALTLASSNYDPERELKLLKMFEENGVPGIIAFTKTEVADHFRKAKKNGSEIVLVDSNTSGPSFSRVNLDNVSGGYQAMKHLIEQGFDQFVFVNGPHSLFQCRDRLRGAFNALEEANIDVEARFTEIQVEKMISDEGEAAFSEIQERSAHGSVGVFCVNDLVALGVSRAVRAHGFVMPRDYGVVGYDNLSFSRELFTPLSSVSQPNYRIGYRAADLLLSEIEEDGMAITEQVIFQPELIVRESSDRG